VTTWTTPDLSDLHPDVEVASPIFRDFGGLRAFSGRIATVRAPNDNTMVRSRLETPGDSRVLVVDGGGSLECALVGDRLGDLAVTNGWRGIIVHGCVRDTPALSALPLGVRAIAANPRKSRNGGAGETDVELTFAGATWRPGAWVYADADGILISAWPLVADQ
jgi:regulator of ribonuclease activity A